VAARPIQASITTFAQKLPTQIGLGVRAQDRHTYDRENNTIIRLEDTALDHHDP